VQSLSYLRPQQRSNCSRASYVCLPSACQSEMDVIYVISLDIHSTPSNCIHEEPAASHGKTFFCEYLCRHHTLTSKNNNRLNNPCSSPRSLYFLSYCCCRSLSYRQATTRCHPRFSLSGVCSPLPTPHTSKENAA